MNRARARELKLRDQNIDLDNQVTTDWMNDLDEETEGGVLAEHFTPQADACDYCASLEDDYPLGEGPIPRDDTHDHCNCTREPVLEASKLQNKGKGELAKYDRRSRPKKYGYRGRDKRTKERRKSTIKVKQPKAA